MRNCELLTDFLFLKETSSPIDGNLIKSDDPAWEKVKVPHDWAIGKDFNPEYDKKLVKKTNPDGSIREAWACGNTGALPSVGIGWYSKELNIGKELEGKRIFIDFDGIMWRSEIYLNGKLVGSNHFGYLSFEVEITDFVKYGETNRLVVKAEVDPDCSRWYSGGGIFRKVTLVIKEASAIKYNGIKITTPHICSGYAEVVIDAEAYGEPDEIKCVILSPNGDKISEGIPGNAIQIANPQLWSTETPFLYTVVTTVYKDGRAVDEVKTKFGFRTFEFDADNGFTFNGKHDVFKGVCNHHDLGILGAAADKSAIRRQLEILKKFGCNAVRTSHNPPAVELLDLCDEMGFYVMDEFFDEWHQPKVKNGYSKYFDEYSLSDAEAIIKRDRNHPCVLIWSIGNEIPEQRQSETAHYAKTLTDFVHGIDPTRPVTMSFDCAEADEFGMPDIVDLVGINYKPHNYGPWHKKHPGYKLYGSETASCLSTRGEFFLMDESLGFEKGYGMEHPAIQNENNTVNSYDLTSPFWAQHPDLEFAGQDDNPSVMGEFVWTGFDYLGEPTPYDDKWPAVSSYFGIVDINGVPKSRYYLYKSRWNKNEHTVFITPHWNWEGMEGKEIPVQIYTDADTAELFLNGVSLGKKKKDLSPYGRYRLVWFVPFEAGVLKAVSYGKDGAIEAETEVRTAGETYALRVFGEKGDFYCDLSSGETVYEANKGEVFYIHAAILDENGTVCPKSDALVNLTDVEGAEFIGSGSGDPRDTTGYASKSRKALNGICSFAFRLTADSAKLCFASGDAVSSVTVNAK